MVRPVPAPNVSAWSYATSSAIQRSLKCRQQSYVVTSQQSKHQKPVPMNAMSVLERATKGDSCRDTSCVILHVSWNSLLYSLLLACAHLLNPVLCILRWFRRSDLHAIAAPHTAIKYEEVHITGRRTLGCPRETSSHAPDHS